MQRALLCWALLAVACEEEPTGVVAAPSEDPASEVAPSEVAAPAQVVPDDGPVTAQTLLAFVPARLGGADAMMREVSDPIAVGAYRTSSGFINLNLGITQSVSFDRAQVRGAESDEVVRSGGAGIEKQGVAVGRFRALRVTMPSSTELQMFLADRIIVRVSMEGQHTNEELVALAHELDLNALERLASRIPAPEEP